MTSRLLTADLRNTSAFFDYTPLYKAQKGAVKSRLSDSGLKYKEIQR